MYIIYVYVGMNRSLFKHSKLNMYQMRIHCPLVDCTINNLHCVCVIHCTHTGFVNKPTNTANMNTLQS